MPRGRMQDVILVEVADRDLDCTVLLDGVLPAADAAPRDQVHLPSRARAWARRRLRLWVPLTMGLVVLLAAGGLASAARARDRDERLGALPGVLAPLDPTLRELWREPMLGWGQVVTIGTDVVLYGPDDRGAVAVASFDASTGERQWTAPLPEVDATGNVRCVGLAAAGPGPSARVACRLVNTSVLEVRDARFRPGTALLVVLDQGSGERVAERRIDGPNEGFAALGPDLIVTRVLPDSRAEVTREDPLTGRARWTFHSAEPLNRSGGGPSWLSPRVHHGVVLAAGPTTWAFAPDGAVLGGWRVSGLTRFVAGASPDVSVLPDGRFAVGPAGARGARDAQYGAVATAGAGIGFPIPGPVLEPAVDDGSAAGTLFTVPVHETGLAALDSATGERRWGSTAAPAGNAIVLDGRLIAVVAGAVTAVDARTGGPLWRVELPPGSPSDQVLTDGRVVVVPTLDPASGDVLTAYSPADGRALWSARLPAGVRHLEEFDGRLLAMTDEDLIGLG